MFSYLDNRDQGSQSRGQGAGSREEDFLCFVVNSRLIESVFLMLALCMPDSLLGQTFKSVAGAQLQQKGTLI